MRSLAEWLTHLEALSVQRELSALPRARGERFAVLKKVATALGVLDIALPIITVAGTNGKGSCVTLLSSIYRAAGYRVGSFTSPHLLRYNERIQINQSLLEDQKLCEAFTKIDKARQGALLGYFEFTTLAGLLLFKEANLDVIVLEVGLGGRLDPVNLVDAEVALISSIDLDHTHILGDTLEAIAFEKAGIMRAKRPCVWGDAYLPNNVKDYAKELGTPLLAYQKDFTIEAQKAQNSLDASWTWSNAQQRLTDLPIPNITYLPNAASVLQVVDCLKERLPVSHEALCKGLKTVAVPGRFQVIEGKVKTILDVAHNPASAKLLAHNLKAQAFKGKIHMVMAVLNTKDIAGILSPLVELVDNWYFGEFKMPKCAKGNDLAKCLTTLSNKPYSVFESVEKAYEAAYQKAQPHDVIVVMGSFHTVEAVMKCLSVHP